ncbi:unnamed protein product, partial [marine sediment metagenome]
AQIELQSKNWTGTARIRATASDGIPDLEKYLNIPVGVSLSLVEDSVVYTFDLEDNISTVSFDIDVQGAELLLEEMQVSWDPLAGETINKIEIKSPPTTDPTVTVTDPVSSEELIDVND